MNRLASPRVPLSWGELIDKITILEIKSERMEGEAGANVRKELALLQEIAAPALDGRAQIAALKSQIKAVNETLWDIEDRIRDKERARAFDAAFVALARSVYRTNDERAALKRNINLLLGSEIVEEKSYKSY